MRATRKYVALAAVASLFALLPTTGALGQASADYSVAVGMDVPHGFSLRAFAPLDHGIPTIHVAQNDVLDVAAGGLLFLPQGTGPLEFAAENFVDVDAPYGFLHRDSDPDLEEPFVTHADYKFNPHFAFTVPTASDCGAQASDPCDIDGSRLFDAGALFLPGRDNPGHFFARVTAPAGTRLWAQAPYPSNRKTALRIEVVATGVDTQAAIDQAAQIQMAEESDAAAALHAKLSKGAGKHQTASGRTVWDAYAGYDTESFALLDFYPARLRIRKGDRVRWHFSQLTMEIHGVAFPLKYAKAVVNEKGFVPVCDPDGDAGSGPDTFSVDFETFTCDQGSLELDLTRDLLAESGDGRYPGGPKRVENSGLRGYLIPEAPGVAGGTDPWDLTFTKKTDSKGYAAICTIHGGFMKNRIVVRGR